MTEIFLYTTFFLSLITLIMLVGIVLRVEQRLDTSFKFILYAHVSFATSVGVDMLVEAGIIPPWPWYVLFKFLFIILFAIGVWEMRRVTRYLDGEIGDRYTKKKPGE